MQHCLVLAVRAGRYKLPLLLMLKGKPAVKGT